MAEIKPLKAWRYNPGLATKIDELTSPLFDVISTSQRKKLYENPLNSIHLAVPDGDIPEDEALKTLNNWKENNILIQDTIPSIYIYYQYFSLANSSKQYCRKGFICNIKAHFWEEKQVLRHENTMPLSVNDRLKLLEKTLLNSSATHGLYSDPNFELEIFMDEAIKNPIYETEDYQGVKDVMAIISDEKIIKKFVNKINDLQIILADGHHRYESSLEFRKEKMQEDVNYTGEEAYNYHMMYLTNMRNNDISILPTHRLITGIENFDKKNILNKISEYFNIKQIDNAYETADIISGKKWTFGLIFDDATYQIKLKNDVWNLISWHFPEIIKELDLTVLHYFIVEKILEIPGKIQRESKILNFSRSLPECLNKVTNNEAQMAFITQSVSIEQVESVCQSGFTMPQKSTYFYPKIICGFLFGSIKEDEF